MSYQMCMEKAGAKIIAYQEFGSYQGDWFAKVEYNNETGWVTGSFGSCSGCDSFENEFNYYDDKCEKHRYEYDVVDCADCDEAKKKLELRYAEFGTEYLGTILPQEKQEELLRNEIADDSNYWAQEKKEILYFVESNK